MYNPEKLATLGTQDTRLRQTKTKNNKKTTTKKTNKKPHRKLRKDEQHGLNQKPGANQKHNVICVGHHNPQTNTNNVNKTRTLLQYCLI
jgi:hypothetical protein